MIFYNTTNAQLSKQVKLSPKVSYDDFETLTKEVKAYRKARLISVVDFLKKSKDQNTIILDTRSDSMYKRKHIKGAIHLNFADFAQSSLAKIIPSFNTTILIYCNNNFDGDEVNFISKTVAPSVSNKGKAITLALNIPTFINLYGYGYHNVFELAEMVHVWDKSIEFEGTDVVVK